ncbi:MAG: hypothetical protein HOK98_14570 [Rhodospirillaceae bacterium]|jgi:hypothetical protein|nr:hypothetical protein [Rhodospirillaceae bacterium]MBT6403699.1 hypothetical protein [Rhodospirillaceae bacterium]MBT6537396.1 hypothetical protein [Rhodospirillaceae bacterium]
MPMDRGSLSKVINAGRSTAFNVYDIGRRIPAHDPVGKLFRNKTLNETMFFKIMERNETQYHTVSTVQTLMYFPYNLGNVYEGGDSILFDDPGFNRMLRVKTGADSKSEESQVDYVMDLEILEMIYSLPTLDPFLLKSKSEQLDLDDRIHPFYFNISEEDWGRIRSPIRTKIRTLVRRAYMAEEASVSVEKMEQHVSRFLSKIWEAKDIEGIEDFVRSMDIPADRAPELFFAWKAICYYQVQFEDFLPQMKSFFSWLGDDKVAIPVDWVRLMPDDRDRVEYSLLGLRDKVRDTYRSIKLVLGNYEQSYRAFINDNQPRAFKDFLSTADEDYTNLATCLSANVHALNIWSKTIDTYGTRLRYEQFNELFDTLSILFDMRRSAVSSLRVSA